MSVYYRNIGRDFSVVCDTQLLLFLNSAKDRHAARHIVANLLALKKSKLIVALEIVCFMSICFLNAKQGSQINQTQVSVTFYLDILLIAEILNHASLI